MFGEHVANLCQNIGLKKSYYPAKKLIFLALDMLAFRYKGVALGLIFFLCSYSCRCLGKHTSCQCLHPNSCSLFQSFFSSLYF